MQISILFFRNNLPVPKVEDRYRLIKEYHESAIEGHKGNTKTYDKLAYEYYWRNTQSDVRQYVRGCPDCQSQKLVRLKTRLPMLISDTPSKPFSKISIDFVGPKEPTETGNRYILTIQNSFSKFCVFVPTRHATAEEVIRALLEKFICYFRSPVTLISDQGTHFINAILEEFARIFKINKLSATAYHPQSNGSIERMHHTLNEYFKLYLQGRSNWDLLLPLAQHAYNVTMHEGLGYTPHAIVFGSRARTPSSFPSKEYLQTYSEYMGDRTHALAQMHTLAAMNLSQSKYKSKFYYDQRQNTRHFRQGELVYVQTTPKPGKTDPQYTGPCEIIDINPETHSLEIRKGEQSRIIHMDMAKRSYELPKSINTETNRYFSAALGSRSKKSNPN